MLRVRDAGEAAALPPVRVFGVFVRLAQRRPELAGLLRFAPRNVGEAKLAHQALHDFAEMRRGFAARAAARAALFGRAVVQIGGHIVALEEVDQLRRAGAPQRHHPAAILGRPDRWYGRNRFGGVAAGLAVECRRAVDPGHQVEFGIFRDGVVDGAGQRLGAPGAMAVD